MLFVVCCLVFVGRCVLLVVWWCLLFVVGCVACGLLGFVVVRCSLFGVDCCSVLLDV